jgi:hypothetical protein
MMQILYALGDDLEDFAAEVLRSRTVQDLTSTAAPIECGTFSTAVSIREGRFQVEVVSMRAGAVVTPHTHPNMDSIEAAIFGCVRLVVGKHDPLEKLSDRGFMRQAKRLGIRVNRGEVHTARCPHDSVFLSIQRWHIAPTSVATDWQGAPLAALHQKVLHDHA